MTLVKNYCNLIQTKMDKNKKKKVEIFIDASNYHYDLKKAGWQINYRKFVDYFTNLYDVIKIYYYEGIP